MARRDYTLLILLLVVERSTFASEIMQIRLGEQRMITLSQEGRVHVSRRGVIHLVHEHGDQWMMTALRRGIVTIQSERVRGKKFKAKIIRVVSDADTPKLTTGLANSLGTSELFHVAGKIVLTRTTHSLETGGASEVGLGMDLVSGAMTPKVNASIGPKTIDGESEVLGEPKGWVIAGRPLVFKSGGEALFHTSETQGERGRSRAVWKEFGMSLDVKLLENKGGDIGVDVEFSLRHPSGSHFNELSLNQIKTFMRMPFGEEILIGQADVEFMGKQNEESKIIDKIPIIAPLFAKHSDTFQKSKILIFLKIDQRQSVGLKDQNVNQKQ